MVDQTNAPALEATGSDPALEPIPAPPADASNNPMDIASGISPEASPELMAAISAAHQEPDPEPPPEASPEPDKPAAFDPRDVLGDDNLEGDTELSALLVNDTTPAWLRQNIKVERDRRRAAIAAQQAAEAEASRLREELATAKAPPPEPEPPRPTRDQFDTPESYDAAIDAWTTAKSERAVAQARTEEQRAQQAELARQAEQKQQEAIQQATTAWNEKRTAAIKVYSDYVEVAESDKLTIQPPTAVAIMQAENGPEIAYHLGKNPEIAARIASMQPLQQVIAIGKLSATLAQPPTREVSKAPPPISPIAGTRGTTSRPTQEPTMEEIAAKERERAAKERAPMWGRAH